MQYIASILLEGVSEDWTLKMADLYAVLIRKADGSRDNTLVQGQWHKLGTEPGTEN